MYQGKVNILGREIVVTAGQDRCRSIITFLNRPKRITSETCGDGFTKMVIFGNAWSWEEFPEERKAKFDELHEAWARQIPDQVTSRTALPSLSWMAEFIPTDDSLKEMREARKTPE